jgi:MazG family protein
MSKNFDELVAVMARLRAPGGCPWDREQTYASLAPYLLEESYEAFDAIFEAAEGQTENLREELGDVLLQVIFHSQIAAENEDFSIEEVVRGVTEKLILRHPHVFGELELTSTDDVLQNWDALKNAERQASGKTEKVKESILDDVSVKFPALLEAQKITQKAAKVGFDWQNAEQIFDKLYEEVEELKSALKDKNEKNMQEEIGDLLFVVVNLARHLQIDAETSLKLTNRKFRQRFGYVEKKLKENNKNLSEATISEMDSLWDEAKKI